MYLNTFCIDVESLFLGKTFRDDAVDFAESEKIHIILHIYIHVCIAHYV